MIAVVQRVLRGSVSVAGETVAQIGPGMVVLAAVEKGDTEVQAHWMAAKLAALRIFHDAKGEKHFDRDVTEIGGAILLVSNFTVAAQTAKGRRPSLDGAAPPQEARALFDKLVERVCSHRIPVYAGRFGADMQVAMVNDGPATFIVETHA